MGFSWVIASGRAGREYSALYRRLSAVDSVDRVLAMRSQVAEGIPNSDPDPEQREGEGEEEEEGSQARRMSGH